jgi:biotin carboxyl carrier protein
MKYRIRIGQREAEVEIRDLHARPIVAVVDGETVEVWPETEAATVAPSPAQPMATVSQKAKSVRAPIPGVIVSVAVQPNDEVSVGQELCVLEAMKMKNPIRAVRAGKIARVYVVVGQAVKQQDPLMDYAE